MSRGENTGTLRAAARPRGAGVLAACYFQWRLLWRRRKLRGRLLLALLPVAFAVLAGALKLRGIVQTLGIDVVAHLLGTFYVQILLVLVPLLLGTSLVAQEAESHTLPFLLVRPLSRGSLYMGKFLGSWAAAAILLGGSYVLASLPLLGADAFADGGTWLAAVPRVLALFVVGTFAYLALFGLVGLLFRRGTLVGLALGLGWESAVPFLPGWIKNLTVRHHLVALLPDGALPAVLQARLDPPSLPAALTWLAVSSLLQLALAIWLFAARDYP